MLYIFIYKFKNSPFQSFPLHRDWDRPVCVHAHVPHLEVGPMCFVLRAQPMPALRDQPSVLHSIANDKMVSRKADQAEEEFTIIVWYGSIISK